MERWQIIERRVLVGVACCLLVIAGWLVVTATPGRLVTAGILALCAYWAFWQALYEDRLGTDAPVTRGELFLFRVWVWGRRLMLGAVSAVLLYVASQLAATHAGSAALVAFLGLLAAWVGWFGGGRRKSLSDDQRVHDERKRRYKGIR